MTRLSFWWQRRRAGMPVPLGSRPTTITGYSKLVNMPRYSRLI